MERKNYNSPDFVLENLGAKDIITTSEIEAGVETPPTEIGGGSWETL